MERLSQDFQDRVSASLRSLYASRGYRRYKMNKFEEYDLYAGNKDFLICDRVITFSDLNGKLMALKPDVTLSIAKNSPQNSTSVQKTYYQENVYRVIKGSTSFREIVQVGLECIGEIDEYCLHEVLTLAGESLLQISSDSLLCVSPFGVLCAYLDTLDVASSVKEALLFNISQKNRHGLRLLCRDAGVPEEATRCLQQLVGLNGNAESVLSEAIVLLEGKVDTAALEFLGTIIKAMGNTPLRNIVKIDFSVVDNANYYNGIVFKGFVKGIPERVLSGGQYDKLMQKLRKNAGAVGFAVYMDALERKEAEEDFFDVDILLLYDKEVTLERLSKAVRQISEQGLRVMAQKKIPENIRYRQLQRLSGDEVKVLENNA